MQTGNKIRNKAYLDEYADILSETMYNKLDGQSILYAIKEILVSNKNLKYCRSYQSLNQYIEKNEELQKQLGELQTSSQELQIRKQRKEEIELLHILSSVVSVVNRGQDMNQVNRITPFYQCVGKEQDAKGYQKQMASIA